MPWVVLKFISTNEVEAIPSSWFEKENNICHYPPETNASIVKKFIQNEVVPQPNWEDYEVKLMVREEFFSLKKASSTATKACFQSDLDEEQYELPIKRQPKKKIISSSDSEDSLEGAPPFPNINNGLSSTSENRKFLLCCYFVT